MRNVVTMMIVFVIFYFGEVVACEKLVPNEIENVRIQSIYRQEKINIFLEEKERTLKVNYEVKGADVYIQCMIDAFSFEKEKVGKSHKDGEGHMIVYVDGMKVDKLFERAFIVKGLLAGSHTIKLELVRNDGQPYGLEKEITVQIS